MMKTFKIMFLVIPCMLMTMTVFPAGNKEMTEPNHLQNNSDYKRSESSCPLSLENQPYGHCRCENQKGELNLKADLLYWRAELGGLEGSFGNTAINTTAIPGYVITTATEDDLKPHFKWKPGFRIGADMQFDFYDIDADWTHFHGLGKLKHHYQHGSWTICYDVIDLTFGGQFTVPHGFYFNPFVGVRGAKIHQSLKSYLETEVTSLVGNNIVLTKITGTEKSWGIGPEAGLEAELHLGHNFSLYGSFDVVGYYGNVKSKGYEKDTFTSTISISQGTKRHCFNCFGTDGVLGIRWDRVLCRCNYNMNFMVKLAWEQHRIYDFSNLGSDGTLSLDGVILELGIGFLY